ncbi:DUF3896 domain-containing protein [Mesobacillus boroniphilus]|uniref:DUF3896 domain-containing protein n=1 Tax=Mesobacillus boroniphilus TaxID=308892 RepID=A0A944GYA8_9BACI|nr:DUF3896 family protein [Mesobacillus boroniphilus]MBS8266529.1 DUF3896 domain-containing protein [Mesobacillus boroniphilus]
MNYQEVKSQLEALQMQLANKMQNPNLSIDEKTELLNAIANYDYIIELTCMNHFERGKAIQ